jgi:Zn-dependent protease with chaperone function
MAIYGFHSQDRQLVLTRGILQTLSRPQKSALIALALCHAARGEVANRTWLASFFDFIQTLLLPFPGRRLTRSASVPLHRVFRQLVLYPLSLFPAFVLGTSEKSAGVDALAIRVTQNPRALAEAFRRVEASSERTPLQTPFSARHLFLTPSPSADPLIRLFFSTSSFENRVHAVETALGRTPA